jgi:hypothetical protein
MKPKTIFISALIIIGLTALAVGSYKIYHYYRDVTKADKENRIINFQRA